jgi:tripartite-type tricarboxylate transporter receptor subunit TctC
MKRLLAGLFLAFALPAMCLAFPEKPVRFIVPFPPGGGTDALARILGAKLAEIWGQQVIVENRAGAQGNIGTAAGARAAPAANLRELAQYARQNPGRLTFASTSAGPHIVGELFKLATGTNLIHVPYKGAGPAINDLLGGQVALMFSNPTSTVPHVKSGKLRALGVMDTKRNPALPDVPTALESGLPELSSVIEWYGVVAPAATPRDTVQRLSAGVLRAIGSPDVVERVQQIGQTPAPANGEEFGRYIRADYERWERVVKASGAKAE